MATKKIKRPHFSLGDKKAEFGDSLKLFNAERKKLKSKGNARCCIFEMAMENQREKEA